MIDQPSTQSLQQQDALLSQELKGYRKVNFNLRRKLKQKDQKIWSLLGIIEQAAKPLHFTPQQPTKDHLHHRDHSLKLSYSQQKREKQNRTGNNAEDEKENLFQSNIFRDVSGTQLIRDQLKLRLPVIQAKSRLQYSNEQGEQRWERKRVKIALQKLKPLERSEVKRRFLERYKRETHQKNQ